jgi:hypothetical protein
MKNPFASGLALSNLILGVLAIFGMIFFVIPLLNDTDVTEQEVSYQIGYPRGLAPRESTHPTVTGHLFSILSIFLSATPLLAGTCLIIALCAFTPRVYCWMHFGMPAVGAESANCQLNRCDTY